MSGTPPEAGVAAHNNADRVDEVARAAGVVTHRDDRRWWAAARTPPFHPDAVSLVPGVGAAAVLAGTDDTAGCSVKDSFADIDLSGHGFAVIIEGSWLAHPGVAAGVGPLGWQWTEGGGVHSAWSNGATVASCTLTRSATVVGVTNVDAGDLDPVTVWGEVLTAAAARAPGLAVVAWDPADAVPAAVAAGFRVTGPMRVWEKA